MENEKILKRHDDRKDLAGEHVFGDLGQIILLVTFLIIWLTDSFFVKYSIQLSEYVPLYIRIALAIIVFIIAGYLARKGLTIVFSEVREKPVVIRKGVFGIVRHPIYLGAILFYLSLLIAFFSAAAMFIWFVIILFYIFLCKHEERLLTEKFGSEYDKYKQVTPMLIPRLFKRKNNASSGIQGRTYDGH